MKRLDIKESALRLVCPHRDRTYIPVGGQPLIGRLKIAAGMVAGG